MFHSSAHFELQHLNGGILRDFVFFIVEIIRLTRTNLNWVILQTIDKLPDKILLQIFSFLSHREICRLARTCRKWRMIAYDSRLWKFVSLRPDVSGLHVASLEALLALIRYSSKIGWNFHSEINLLHGSIFWWLLRRLLMWNFARILVGNLRIQVRVRSLASFGYFQLDIWSIVGHFSIEVWSFEAPDNQNDSFTNFKRSFFLPKFNPFFFVFHLLDC